MKKINKVEPKEVKIPFRKKWIPVSECPSWYLKWIAENWREDTKQNKIICSAADQEYQFRKKHNLLGEE